MPLNKNGVVVHSGTPIDTAALASTPGTIKPAPRFEDGAKEGNRRNVAAVIVQGLTMVHGYKIEEALAAFDKVHAHLVAKDS